MIANDAIRSQHKKRKSIMSIIDQTIQNLELISRTLDKASFHTGNDDWSTYLEHASMNLFRESQWLKEKKELIKGFFDEDDRRCK